MRLLRAVFASAVGLCVLGGSSLAAIHVGPVHVKVMERTGDKQVSQTLEYPQKLASTPKLTASTPFSLAFTAFSDASHQNALALDQALVVMRHASTGDEVTLAGKMGAHGSYRVDVARKQFRAQLAGQPGKYTVRLVLGSFDQGALVYPVGEVQVAGKQARAADTVVYGRREEIRHRFGEPQKMPSVLVSLAFAVLAAAPLGALVAAWQRMGVRVRSVDGAAAGFLALVAAYMALAAAYWVGVRLLPTLAYVLALALPTYVAGQRALSRRRAAKQ
ncbi:proteasome regulatory particle base subunit [Coemansia interrupta]|uniref:Ribophorin II n=1 Tax=Coemansia interrupta TaxID=1126814 RepID=A0A9W8HP98_9FUNG|nr:proteasome regulatory particle base subunit [Coemansia interrupta]